MIQSFLVIQNIRSALQLSLVPYGESNKILESGNLWGNFFRKAHFITDSSLNLFDEESHLQGMNDIYQISSLNTWAKWEWIIPG